MKNLLEDEFTLWASHEYVTLRDLATWRVTLYNAKRVGDQNPSTLPLDYGARQFTSWASHEYVTLRDLATCRVKPCIMPGETVVSRHDFLRQSGGMQNKRRNGLERTILRH